MKSQLLPCLLQISSLVAAVFVCWMAWPAQDVLAPESTGEIGFLGVVVVAKYAAYGFRAIIAVGLAGVIFSAFMLLRHLAVEPNSQDSTNTEPVDNIAPRNPFN